MPTSDRGLHEDDRGAVMVLGIFMCACLVGALWYLAGIGDAILLRERAQEAADAVAFSDAALHARGMNLIVLVNLVMACILGIRVALKIAQLLLTIAAAVFTALGFLSPPFWALVGPCLYGVQVLEQAITTTRAPINAALQALSLSQDGISLATPAAARAGAKIMVGDTYAPGIPQIGVTHFGSDTSLPIESGSQDKLCKEAGRTVGYLTGWVLEKAGLGAIGGSPAKWLGDKFAWIASLSPQHFCEIGSATGDIDVSELFEEPAKNRCENEPDAEREAFKSSEKDWESKCAEYGVACNGTDDKGNPSDKPSQTGTTTPERRAELDRLRLLRDQDARGVKELHDRFKDQVDSGGRAKCEAWAKADMQRRQTEQVDLSKKQQVPTSIGALSGARPKKAEASFVNGHHDGQVAGGAIADPSGLTRSSRLVRVGAWKGTQAPSGISPASLPSWAQAEFFFDCSGKWEQCNDDEDAMWHLKWRARLRRWNEPESLEETIAEMGVLGGSRLDLEALTERAESTPSWFVPNPDLRAELDRALATTRKRGVH